MRITTSTLSNLGYWVVTTIVTVVTTLFLIFGVGFHALLTNSMAPDFPAGSVVVTIQTSTARIEEGDVIKLPLPGGHGEHYVHRVVEVLPIVTATTVVTKGDNNPSPDPWTLEILSPTTPRVIASVPFVGYLNELTHSTGTKLFLASMVMGGVGLALHRVRRSPHPRAGTKRAHHRQSALQGAGPSRS